LNYWENKMTPAGKKGKATAKAEAEPKGKGKKADAKAKAKSKAKAEPKEKAKKDGKGAGKSEKKGEKKGTGKGDGEKTYKKKPIPIQLGYWEIRGLGAPCRMMLSYGGVEFKDTRYSWDGKGEWFGTDKPKLAEKNSLINLPYVVDGEKVVTQSNAVLNYIARKSRVTGAPYQRTDIDMMLCDCYDLRDTFVNRMYWYKNLVRNVKEFDDMKKEYIEKQAGPFYAKYEAWLSSKNSDFMCGKRPTVCDFHVWEILDQHEMFAKDLGQDSPLGDKPKLKEYYERFRELDKLKGYFESDAYKLPCNVPAMSFWSGPGSKPPADAPKK
jgi:glutathione S-transferase